jgi:hypothetical protein
LLFLWGWRANFWLPPSPPPAKTLNLVFVEVTGAAAHPGVYSFDHAPTLAEAWRRSGVSRRHLQTPAVLRRPGGNR